MSILNVLLLSAGLAVDASCVASANGIAYQLSLYSILKVALFFAVFQAVMPMVGYGIVQGIGFDISRFTPYIALVILGALGVKMILDGVANKEAATDAKVLSIKLILLQSISTSIDALSVGTFLVGLSFVAMIKVVAVIGVTTFLMCILAGVLGTKIGTKLNNKAEIVGGLVLIFLGIKIFLES
ncbi:manganese efflux pump MntP family protein [Candidatus Epulonipiscium viviparus]|uniref:manganese efflux pump MntP n=1 Tax=Candidatus Epulonipiscium viviparus TaxID=420336 RepID=UPI0027380643|nr:manganese efflux pump [Candidatus Epulopiscium viviparus]